MAIIDIERDVVVVRIVYDGPPLSGKTASLKALENILGTTTQLFSPDKAVTDRSIQFNWLEYIGGSFQGREICCQIISVPNYASQECREFLLHSADVVVCVFDAAHISGEEGRKYFEQLHKTLSNRADGLITHTVIQANKQDFSSACSGDDFSAFFHGFSDLHIVESIATTGKGVREGFVLAVRLSIEHVKQLSEIDLLDKGAPDIKTGRELFAYLRTHFIDSSPTESTEFSEGLESLHDLSSHLQGQETLGLTEDESLDSLGNIDVDELADLPIFSKLPEEELVADISDLDELENDLAELEEIGELPEEEPVADISDLDELENDLDELEEIGELPEEESVAEISDLDELENDLAELEEIGGLPEEESVAEISDLDELENDLGELEEIGELPEEEPVADISDLDELENDLTKLEGIDELPEEESVAEISDLDELENDLVELEEIGELPEEALVADSSDLDELENDLAELEEIGELPEAELESVDELPEEEPVADSSDLDELENDLAELEETGELPEEELVAEISALEELESNFVPLEEIDELADTSKSNELEHDIVLANTLLEQDKVEKPVFPVIDEYAFTDDKQPKPELSGITKVNEIPDSESLIEVADDVEEQTEEFVQLKSNEASFSQEELSHLKTLPEIEETVDIEALSKGTSALHIVGEVEALDDPVLPPELDEVDNAELTEAEIEELDKPVELETIAIDTSSSSIEEEEPELLEENTLPSELADISNDELEASGEELVLPDLSGEEAEADFSHEELQVLKQPFEQDEILEAATDEIDDLDDLVVDEFSGGGAIDEDNSSGSDDELPLSEEEELAMLEESDVLPETAELTDTADQLVKDFTDELAELSEDLDVESDGDEVCVVEHPSIIVPTEKARPNYSKRLPKFPDEYTPTRWIWPPFTGQEILGEIFKYSAMPHRGKSGIWVIDTKNHWRCISKPAWHYHGKDEARDALRQHISIHIKCSPIVSDNRCVAITPDHGDSWRLWQIIFIEETLADSLMRSIDSHDNTVVAQALWETSYYYAEACQACHNYPVEFNLALHNFILNKQRELSYLGSLDNEVEIEKLPHSPITHEQIVEYVKDSFEESIQKIIEHDYDIEALIATLEHIDAGDDMYLLDAIAELLIEAV